MPNEPNFDGPKPDQYADWFRDLTLMDIDGGAAERLYDLITPALQKSFEDSPIWQQLLSNLDRWNNHFLATHDGYRLFQQPLAPVIGVKLYERALNKAYRWNVRENPQWPRPPLAPLAPAEFHRDDPNLWYGPHNWLVHFHDIVRTRLTVTYLDGVKFLADWIAELAANLGVPADTAMIADSDGYHAVHVRIPHTFESINFETRDPETVSGKVEIQVTTVIKESINDILHSIYESSRLDGLPKGWQWEPEKAPFVNYLGHAVHHLEGTIVTARKRVS